MRSVIEILTDFTSRNLLAPLENNFFSKYVISSGVRRAILQTSWYVHSTLQSVCPHTNLQSPFLEGLITKYQHIKISLISFLEPQYFPIKVVIQTGSEK